jgi:hypothetical protein
MEPGSQWACSNQIEKRSMTQGIRVRQNATRRDQVMIGNWTVRVSLEVERVHPAP